MLSPNVIQTCDDLAAAHATLLKLDAFAFRCMNTTIGQLSPDPAWLGSIRSEVALLSNAGASWQSHKPLVWTPILQQFTSYQTLFGGLVDAVNAEGYLSKDVWMQILPSLSEALGKASKLTQAAQTLFTDQLSVLNSDRKVFDTSLDAAWRELAEEEETMVSLAEQVTALIDKVDNLSEELTSGEIDDGKEYVKTVAEIAYTMASTAGEDVPYLAILSLVYTVGDLVYDLVVKDPEISEILGQIAELRNQVSFEAQAAAMTKAVIQLIDNFDKALLSVERQLPPIATMWDNEQTKVQQAINALNAGANPGTLFDLQTLKPALVTWQQLSIFSRRLTDATTASGRNVVITTKSQPPYIS